MVTRLVWLRCDACRRHAGSLDLVEGKRWLTLLGRRYPHDYDLPARPGPMQRWHHRTDRLDDEWQWTCRCGSPLAVTPAELRRGGTVYVHPPTRP